MCVCVWGEEVDRQVRLGSQYVTPPHSAAKIDLSSRRGKASQRQGATDGAMRHIVKKQYNREEEGEGKADV